jgi:hypothetical protein
MDYLEGGSGKPPVVPPRRYWGVQYQTPEGHLAIADWFSGYRLGSTTVQQSGYKHWVNIPTSLENRSDNGSYAVTDVPDAILITSKANTTADDSEGPGMTQISPEPDSLLVPESDDDGVEQSTTTAGEANPGMESEPKDVPSE